MSTLENRIALLVFSAVLPSVRCEAGVKSYIGWALGACGTRIVLLAKGQYDDFPDSRQSIETRRSKKWPSVRLDSQGVPAIPEGHTSPVPYEQETFSWEIPSSPSEAVPLFKAIVRRSLQHVYYTGLGGTRHPIQEGSAAETELFRLLEEARPGFEAASLARDGKQRAVLHLDQFQGLPAKLFVWLRRNQKGGLELSIRKAHCPMAALVREISNEVVGKACIPQDRFFVFQGETRQVKGQALDYLASLAERFALSIGHSEASSVRQEVVRQIQEQLATKAMSEYLSRLQWSLVSSRFRETPFDVVNRAFIESMVSNPSNLESLKALVSNQAGWQRQKKGILNRIESDALTLRDHPQSVYHSISLSFELGRTKLKVTVPVYFSWILNGDGTVKVVSATTSFVKPNSMPPGAFGRVTEFDYHITAEDPEEAERLAYWLERSVR
jgi:hypothetical protein